MKKILPLLMVLAFAGCKKDNDTTGLLTRSWQITAMTNKSNAGVSAPMDISSCVFNRIWTFQKDGTFLSVSSPNCISAGTAGDPLNGTWNLMDNKSLKIDAQGAFSMHLEAQILGVTKSKLVLRQAGNSSGGGRVGGGGGGGFGGGGGGTFYEITYEYEAR